MLLGVGGETVRDVSTLRYYGTLKCQKQLIKLTHDFSFPPKFCSVSTELHGTTSLKTAIFVQSPQRAYVFRFPPRVQ